MTSFVINLIFSQCQIYRKQVTRLTHVQRGDGNCPHQRHPIKEEIGVSWNFINMSGQMRQKANSETGTTVDVSTAGNNTSYSFNWVSWQLNMKAKLKVSSQQLETIYSKLMIMLCVIFKRFQDFETTETKTKSILNVWPVKQWIFHCFPTSIPAHLSNQYLWLIHPGK